MPPQLPIDVVIFGGGAAGLWLLDELVRQGHSTLLLEGHDLGSGQTITSQGIIHGGLKYTLSGLFTSSARAISEMPLIWRRCLAGEATPDLTGTRLRAEYCYLWRTTSLRSRLAMIGARAGLLVKPVTIEAAQRPKALRDCPGIVARLDEQVIDPASFVSILSQQHIGRVFKIDSEHGLEFDRAGEAGVIVRLINPETGEPHDLLASTVVLAAGAGNERLQQMLGIDNAPMQRRPLHMVMVRAGDERLPPLNGHCVDGSATRATITTARDFDDRTVWQVGGQIAEAGATMQPRDLLSHARQELERVLPGVDLANLEWATYRVDRAEPRTRGGARPDEAFAQRHERVITAWPTKLALVPEMVRRVIDLLSPMSRHHERAARTGSGARALERETRNLELPNWPRPVVALPPWEIEQQWIIDP